MKRRRETRKQLFIATYVKTGCAHEAAIRAGYSPKTATAQAQNMLQKPDVAKEIAERMAKVMQRAEVTLERTLAELALIAYAPLGDDNVKAEQKRFALNDLMRYFGAFDDHVRHTYDINVNTPTSSATMSSPPSSPDERRKWAAQILLTRRRATESLRMFHDYMGLERAPAVHHLALMDCLQQIVDGELTRLLVLMPPGHAKSHYASVEFPAFIFGKHSDWSVIQASYGTDLATDFGGRVRDIVRSEEFRTLFPDTDVRDDTRAKDDWRTTAGGRYFAAGVGRGITGRRGNVAILDDLIKDRKEADSITVRDSTWSWYLSALRTRLLPGAAIVMIATRWHEDDPAGRMLPKDWNGASGWIEARDGERWYVLVCPRRRVSGIRWAVSRANGCGRRSTRPTSTRRSVARWGRASGARCISNRPRRRRARSSSASGSSGTTRSACRVGHTYFHSDYAVRADEDGDWTELMISGLDCNDDLYLAMDSWSGQTSPDVWIDAELDLIARHTPLIAFGEGGVIRRAVEPFQVKRSRERRVYCRREWLTSITDKMARARGLQARAAAGKVYLPEDDRGHRLFMHLLAFPAAAEDHTVDACSLLCRGIDQMVAGKPPADPRKRSQLRDYGNADLDEARGSWRTA